jgi:hypothetical protein
MTKEETGNGTVGKPLTTVTINYIKSQHFRVILSTGIIGGPTPTGMLHMAFFNERRAIPQIQVHDVIDGGMGLSDPIKSIGREGMVRELECDVQMDLQNAIQLRKWLDDQIPLLSAITKKMNEVRNKL